MPIFEFGCPDCRTIYQFWGKASDRNRRPTCPRCGRRNLTRVPSTFAVSSATSATSAGGGEAGNEDGAGAGPDPLAGMSATQQARMERELSSLMAKAESLDENNPREMGAFMRRMTEVAGMPADPTMQEAIRRMEAGENPDRIEEELGDFMGEMDEPGDLGDMGGMEGTGGMGEMEGGGGGGGSAGAGGGSAGAGGASKKGKRRRAGPWRRDPELHDFS